MMDAIDCAVIGAGVVGLAVARALAQAGQEVVIIERASQIGTGASSRNSEVIHAGLYYTPGSLKATLCVRGRDLLYAHAASHQVAHRRCGKWIVATEADQLPALERIADRARSNGVPVRWLSPAEWRRQEPALRACAVLESPSTGIVDSHALMQSLLGDVQAAGGALALTSTVEAIEASDAGFDLQVATPDGQRTPLRARRLVNAAGLHACEVAALVLGAGHPAVPRPHLAKGSYFGLAGRSPFSRLVYPAPQDAWLGVHLTLDLGGQARFGPDLQWLDHADPLRIDYAVDPSRADAFYAAIRRYWPALPDGALQPAYSGVRPKIHGPDEPAPDFRLDGESVHGVAGLVNLLGIESPGLTSALAIAEAVQELLAA